MSLMISFLSDGEELRLPVPPLPFGWAAEQNIREVTVNGSGTVTLPGDPAATSATLSVLLPAHDYPFVIPGSVLDPYYYIGRLVDFVTKKKIVRYVVPGVINDRVVIQGVTYEERDGSGDVYATIYLRGSPTLEAVTTETVASSASGSSNAGRGNPETAETMQTYTVVTGDCLSVICRRYYGNGSAQYYNALADYNGIKNPHLIYPGQVITLPPRAQLGL